MTDKDKKIQDNKSRIEEVCGFLTQKVSQNGAPAVTGFSEATREMKIGEGWAHARLFEDESFDVWLREGKRGATLPCHCHPDHDLYITCLRGQVEARIGEDTKLLGATADTIKVPRGTELQMEALSEARLLCVYQPPIGP